jgi:hypothetical protein
MGFSCVNLSLNLNDVTQRRTKKGFDGFANGNFRSLPVSGGKTAFHLQNVAGLSEFSGGFRVNEL